MWSYSLSKHKARGLELGLVRRTIARPLWKRGPVTAPSLLLLEGATQVRLGEDEPRTCRPQPSLREAQQRQLRPPHPRPEICGPPFGITGAGQGFHISPFPERRPVGTHARPAPGLARHRGATKRESPSRHLHRVAPASPLHHEHHPSKATERGRGGFKIGNKDINSRPYPTTTGRP